MEVDIKNMMPQWEQKIEKAGEAALYMAGLRVFTESQGQTPRKIGALVQSGKLHQPVTSGGSTSVKITYGGTAKAYAWVQHERLDYNHPRGGKAKYLEDPMTTEQRGFAARMAADIRSMVGGGA